MKARKVHKCSLCGKEIAKGENYIYERVAPWSHPDNECFFTYRAHDLCNQLWIKVGEDWEWTLPDTQDFNELRKTYLTVLYAQAV